MAKTDTTQIVPADQTFNENLYNILMGAIEPDLTTFMIPVLEEVYLGETEPEYRLRMARYAEAIDRFTLRAQEFTRDFQNAISAIGTQAVQLAKQMQEETDTTQLHKTEESLDNT